jgi:iron complex outermembrane recepter protein
MNTSRARTPVRPTSVRPVRTVPAAVAAALALCAAGTAFAADAPATAAAEGAALSEVTVTGSRIVRRDLEAASPIVTVTDQVFEESSTVAVESVLNQLPQFVPANTQFNTADIFPSATTTPGISTVSLRGLGPNRTLVLVDGRRFQPANSTLVIDTNAIPASALESVEIISGGASAVYGADALAGVTNFKLKSNFQGIDLQYRSGITERGDGQENRLSLLLGSSLGDGRGNAMLGIEWSERGEVLATDRSFYTRAFTDSNTNAGALVRMNRFQYEPGAIGGTPSQVAANALYPERPAGYVVPRTSAFLFNDDATLFKQERQGLGFNDFNGTNTTRYKVAPNGQLVENNFDLRYSSPLERYSIFGKANFELNDRVEAFTQINFVNTSTVQVSQPSGAVGGFAATIPYGNDRYGPSLAADGVTTLPEYRAGGRHGLNCPATGGCTQSQAFPVPAELAALLNSRGPNVTSNATTPISFDPVTGAPNFVSGVDASWRLGGTLNFLPPRQIENSTDLYQVLGGFRGKLGLRDWTWEAYLSHGATRTDLNYVGFASTERWRRVVTSPNFGRGASVTGTGSTTLTCTTGLPVFRPAAVSDDCARAINGTYTDRTRLTQDVFEAIFQGGLFELPAGEVRAAAGATWRENAFEYLPDATREVNSIVDIPIGTFGQANVRGDTTVKEIYGEFLVPVLRDVFLAKKLELELGYRYSDYDYAGAVPTWKALFSWEPIDFVRVRGGYQAANRAPNINELFLDASSQAVTMRGPEYCRADTRELTGNNPANPRRAQAQALCAALIGNATSEFSADPNNYLGGRGDGVILNVSSGNRNLKSEDGETWTLGFVLSSPFESAALSNASIAVDWYRAKITEAISTVTAQITYDLCFNRDGRSNPTYSLDDVNGVCRNITRDQVSGAAQEVNSVFQNLGVIDTSGLDIALSWRSALADIGLQSLPGALSANVSFTKTFEFKAQEVASALPLENVGTLARGGLFDWRTTFNLRYSMQGWDVALNWRHLPSVRNAAFVTDPATTIQGAAAYDIVGLTGNWNVTSHFSVSGGVDNLFDVAPERVGAGQIQTIAATSGGGQTILNGSGATSANYYDVLGRRYFVNLKMRF